MFDKLSKKNKRQFIIRVFVLLPIGFVLGLLIAIGLIEVFKVEISTIGIVFILTCSVISCLGAVIFSYKKLL